MLNALARKYKWLYRRFGRRILANHKSPRLKSHGNTYPDSYMLFYDLEVSPLTFDFAWALCFADYMREKEGKENLHVVIIPGDLGGGRVEAKNYNTVIDLKARLSRIHTILVPMIELLKNNATFTVCSTRKLAKQTFGNAFNRCPENYNFSFPVAHNPKNSITIGSQIQRLQATSQGSVYIQQWLQGRRKNRKLIVINLRDYPYMPLRNSNIEEWQKFVDLLDCREYFIVVIPDMYHVMENFNKLENVTVFPEVCFSLSLRMALYEEAYMNLGVSNGTMSLLWLNSKTNYIMFKILVPEVPQSSKDTLQAQGYTIGSSPGFVGKFQKWVWGSDDFESISSEFFAMSEKIDAFDKQAIGY